MILKKSTHSSRLISVRSVAAAVAMMLAFGGAHAAAQDDIYTDHASEKGSCAVAPDMLISLAEDAISGTGFSCELSNFAPAGSGLSNYDGACIIDGQEASGYVTFDLGNYSDHFEVALPTREGWLSMYPCTPMAQLEN